MSKLVALFPSKVEAINCFLSWTRGKATNNLTRLMSSKTNLRNCSNRRIRLWLRIMDPSHHQALRNINWWSIESLWHQTKLLKAILVMILSPGGPPFNNSDNRSIRTVLWIFTTRRILKATSHNRWQTEHLLWYNEARKKSRLKPRTWTHVQTMCLTNWPSLRVYGLLKKRVAWCLLSTVTSSWTQ